MGKAREYLANVSAQGIGRICSMGASIAVFVIVARQLGTDAFGKFSYVLTFLSASILLAEFGTGSVIGKDLVQVRDSLERYWGNFLILRLVMGLAMIIPTVGIAYVVRGDLFPYLLFSLMFLPILASHFFEPVFQVFNRPLFSAYTNAGYGIVYLALVVMTLLVTNDIMIILAAYVVANTVYCAVALYLACRLLKPALRLDLVFIKKILKIAFPIGFADLFVIVNTRAAIFIMAYMRMDHQVAIYNAAFRFVEMTAILAVVAMTPIIPILSQQAVTDRAVLKRTFTIIIEAISIIVLPCVILLPTISPLVIHLLFGQAFAESIEVLNILGWMAFLVFFSLFGSALCLSIEVVNFKYWNTVLAASVNVILNYLWIPKYGAVGSAWVALICEVLLSTVTFIYIIKHIGNVFNPRQWLKIIGMNSILFVLVQLLSEDNAWMCVLIAPIIYVPMLFALRLMPRNVLSLVRNALHE